MDSDDDDETTGLTKTRSNSGRRKSAPGGPADLGTSTDSLKPLRRHSTTLDDYAEQSFHYSTGIMLKKRIIGIYVQLAELKSFIELNQTGFRKVLKKFDKILFKDLRPRYMQNEVEKAYPFRRETKEQLSDDIAKMVTAYAEIVTQGDEDLARKDLQAHLREHVVWERNTVWRDMIGMERRAAAAGLGQSLLGANPAIDENKMPASRVINTPMGRFVCPAWLLSSSIINLLVAIALFFAALFIRILEKPEQQNCLALLVFVSYLWATEVSSLHITPFVFRDSEEG
jgi:phosphate transporter